uniref:Putative secreted protein n=1 Tax=Anopheles marajoara TaxID=58244 RepID=A0A2M4CC46_9DIPT
MPCLAVVFLYPAALFSALTCSPDDPQIEATERERGETTLFPRAQTQIHTHVRRAAAAASAMVNQKGMLYHASPTAKV